MGKVIAKMWTSEKIMLFLVMLVCITSVLGTEQQHEIALHWNETELDFRNETNWDFRNETELDFRNETVVDFRNETVWDFRNETVVDFRNETVVDFLDFRNETVVDFRNETVVDFQNETDCDCGENSLHCNFDRNGNKQCFCKYKYAQLNGTCAECYCGVNTASCGFDDNVNKKCLCNYGYGLRGGECVDCDCSLNSLSCHYDWRDNKICKCKRGYEERNGKCAKTCKWNFDCTDGRICRRVEDDKYVCDCPPNYGGNYCQTNLICANMDPPCRRKGAECVVKDNMAYCRCPPEKKFSLLSGLCEEFCTFQTCLNGKCEVVKVGNVAVNYKCKCADGYTGMRCEVKIQGGSREELVRFTILASLNFLLFLLLSVMFCFMCRNRKQMV
ncbi:EGF-like domain-containing protein [Trichonephila inaurata madagascariensis]|uniref:EGF-like domain-containing protein n=1 Tax=Trichonephila inaurata madagascariensis TaxID=2747483 RepID=A0A8X6XZK5_9ARAC|nr:EGF-like domain-containing protein [Trichonephila inaurata madagascariensis]